MLIPIKVWDLSFSVLRCRPVRVLMLITHVYEVSPNQDTFTRSSCFLQKIKRLVLGITIHYFTLRLVGNNRMISTGPAVEFYPRSLRFRSCLGKVSRADRQISPHPRLTLVHERDFHTSSCSYYHDIVVSVLLPSNIEPVSVRLIHRRRRRHVID